MLLLAFISCHDMAAMDRREKRRRPEPVSSLFRPALLHSLAAHSDRGRGRSPLPPMLLALKNEDESELLACGGAGMSRFR